MAWYKYFSVEVPLLLCFFSQMMLSAVSTNLYIYRTCYVILGYNESDCAQLGNEENDLTKHLEPLIQPTVNKIAMVLRVIGTAIPIFFCMFVGTWSDNFGRKPFLVLNLVGLTISSCLDTVIAYFPNVSPWYFVASSLPMSITGSYSILFIVITMYLADVSTPEDRVLRLGIFEALQAVGSLLGSLTAPALFYATSYVAVYGIATCFVVISTVYTVFAIPESINVKKKIPTIHEISQITNFSEIILKTFKKREKNGRSFVIVFMGIIMMYYFASMGDSSVRNLFLRKKLQWTLTKISFASSFGSVLFIAGTMLGSTVLYKTMKFKEIHILLFSLTALMCANLLRGIASNGYYIYCAYILSSFGGLTSSMVRTLMSFIVGLSDIGKLYATSSALDSLSGAIAYVIFPLIYNATLEIDTGIFYFVIVGVNAIQVITVLNLLRFKIPMCEEIINKEKENQDKGISVIGKKLSIDLKENKDMIKM